MRDFQKIWEDWEKTHNDKYRDEAYMQLQPKIDSDIRNVHDIPRSVLQSEYAKAVYKAFDGYNPKKGTFKTYLYHNLKRTNRLIYQNYSFALPESTARKMNTYNAAYAELSAKLGREPSTAEMADFLNWSLKDVTQLNRQMFKGNYDIVKDQKGYIRSGDNAEYVIEMIYHDSNPNEQAVLEYIFGMYGKPALKTNAEISRATGLTLYQVKHIRAKLFKRIKKALE